MHVTVADTQVHIDTDRIDGDISGKLDEYMSGEHVTFDEPVDLSDYTRFQQHVLNEIRAVPYGDTVTYAELAERIDNPAAVRAIGNACGVNPVPIVIPCHRVIATNGVGGYRYGADVKQALLQLEDISL